MTGDAEAAAGLVSANGAPAAPALPSAVSAADIRLFGKVDDAMLRDFLGQLDLARQRPGPLLLELTTTGGDADARPAHRPRLDEAMRRVQTVNWYVPAEEALRLGLVAGLKAA